MAIKEFSNVFELRQQILDVLTQPTNLLGIFTAGENNGDPAIWVAPPEPPAETKGIRCLIQRTPEGPSQPSSSRLIQRDEYWKIILTNFDWTAKHMAAAKQRMEAHFLLPGLNGLQPKYLEPTGGEHEKLIVWIWRPVAIDRRAYGSSQ